MVGKMAKIRDGMKEPALSLFVLTSLFTVTLLMMFIIEGVTHRFQTPPSLVYTYLSLLTVYVGSKELVDRWIRGHIHNRPGEVLVMLWGVLVGFLFIIEYFSNRKIVVPPLMIITFKTVLAIFFGSVCSKFYYLRRQK